MTKVFGIQILRALGVVVVLGATAALAAATAGTPTVHAPSQVVYIENDTD